MTGSNTSTTLPPDNVGVLPQNTQNPASSMLSEVLLPSETSTSKKTAVKSVKKRSLSNNPMLYFMKYYAKHKVWQNDNANPGNIKTSKDYHTTKYLGNDAFDINNDLIEMDKKKVKRSVKKGEHWRLPEDPFQDISYVAKHKPGVKYVKDNAEVMKIKSFLDKIRKGNGLVAKKSLKHLEKSLKSIQKRSIDFTKVLPLNSIRNTKIEKESFIAKLRPGKGYYKKLHKRSVDYAKKVKPERSRNPQGDISYYIKNKPGTNYNVDPVQTALVRAGLERIFQNPNIEVVRRYGSRGPVYSNVILDGSLITFTDLAG